MLNRSWHSAICTLPVFFLQVTVVTADNGADGAFENISLPLYTPLNQSLQQTIGNTRLNQQKALAKDLNPPQKQPSSPAAFSGIRVPPGTTIKFVSAEKTESNQAAALPNGSAAAQVKVAPDISPKSDSRKIKLNFRNADLSVVVDYMARLYGLKPIIFGKNTPSITLFSEQDISLQEAYAIFTATLDNQSLAVSCNDQFMWIMPKNNALQFPQKQFHGRDPSVLPNSDEMVTMIIPCINVSAVDLKPLLTPIASVGLSGNNIMALANSNQLVIFDTASNIKRMLNLIKVIDVPNPNKFSSLETAVYYIKYLNAKDLAICLTSAFRVQASITVKDNNVNNNQIIIQSYDESNAILVTALPDLQKTVAATIQELDKRKKQVLLQVKFLEATRSRNFDFGSDFAYSNGESSFRMGSSDSPSNSSSLIGTDKTAETAYTFTNGTVSLAIQALLVKAHAKILSQPKLLTADNKKATFSVGTQQPIVKSTTTTNTVNNNTVTDYTYLKLGISMDVTPHINPSQDVTLDLKLSISNILKYVSFSNASAGATNNTTTNVPVLSNRELETSALIKHGHTLMIAGIISQDENDTQSSSPFLGDIPWLGWLFGNDSEERNQTELIIIITPYVIDQVDSSDSLTKAQQNQLHVKEKDFKDFNKYFEDKPDASKDSGKKSDK